MKQENKSDRAIASICKLSDSNDWHNNQRHGEATRNISDSYELNLMAGRAA